MSCRIAPYPSLNVPYRSPARFLAPLALVASFIAVYVIIKPSSDSDVTRAVQSVPSQTSTSTNTSTSTTTGTSTTSGPSTTTYTIKSGDVLSAIAEEKGVSLDAILELNPDLDPQSLRTGQKIKIPR